MTDVMTDVVTAVVICGLLALWFIASRQSALDRATAANRARDAVDRRPDDTPPVLKAKTWTGVDR